MWGSSRRNTSLGIFFSFVNKKNLNNPSRRSYTRIELNNAREISRSLERPG